MEEPLSSRDQEPIAALASGSGASAIALLRMSGDGCHELAMQVLPRAANAAMRRAIYTTLIDPDSRVVLDDVVATFYAGPHSFTGQDSVEIACHGGPYVVRRALQALYAAGARPAEPGEFTRRAFLNGKLDLTAAEGIRALVGATSEQEWVAARHLATGKLKDSIDSLRRELVESMAYLEAQIDFPDEGDTARLHLELVRTRVDKVRSRIGRLRASYDDGRVASRGLAVALFGAPNAGKSTLMNDLLGRDRAIVSAIAGTTRDYLEEPCLIEGRLLRLIDLAGARDSQDPIERLGVESAFRLAREADLVLFLVGADHPRDPAVELLNWETKLTPRAALKVLTKADLGIPVWAEGDDWIKISCRANVGSRLLKQRLAAAVDAHVSALTSEESFVTAARHAHALDDALRSIDQFFNAVARGAYEEMLAFELQQAARSLEQLVGKVDHEDVLDKIFSEFCIGK